MTSFLFTRASRTHPTFALLAALALLLGFACPSTQAQTIKVTTTTSMVSDLVKTVGGDQVEVTGLMGPGVDPHLYKPSALDVFKLQQADIIFYSGLLLEGKMTDLFARMARTQKHVYAVTETIPENQLLEPPQLAGHYDPHVWFDVPLWSKCVDAVVRALTEVKPDWKSQFAERGALAQKRMMELHHWTLATIEQVPAARRILITSHDAFNYFGRAYDFQVVGLQGISTTTEPGLADITKMVDFIKKKQVKAIFVETSVSPAAIQRISQDSGARIGGELFSDAMGTPGKIENGYDLGTYEGMIKHNVLTVVNALK